MNFIKYNLVLLFVFYLSIVSSVFANSFGSFTNEEIRAHARVVDYHASLIIGQANIALSGMAELIKRVDLTEDEAHELLGNTVDHLDGVRAIIFISEDGKLTFDSFSSPVPDVNLATRSYFIKAMEADEDHLIIDKPVAGKTSGIPFLPIARAVWKDGKPIGVLTAIITPSTLVVTGETQDCLQCFSLLTDLSGNIISQYPVGVELSEDFKEKMNAANLPVKGTEIIKIGLLDARIYWIRNNKYPFISVFLEFINR